MKQDPEPQQPHAGEGEKHQFTTFLKNSTVKLKIKNSKEKSTALMKRQSMSAQESQRPG